MKRLAFDGRAHFNAYEIENARWPAARKFWSINWKGINTVRLQNKYPMRKRKILIVDDEEAVAHVMVTLSNAMDATPELFCSTRVNVPVVVPRWIWRKTFMRQ